MSDIHEICDVIVVGAGHAGCEAALASARLGMKTCIFTLSVDNIAMMPCNPNIGGTSKGHLVREVDALGGEMGKNIDATFIQSRMLNRSKGPAVHSLRAQADKREYSGRMRRVLENTENLRIIQAEAAQILGKDGRVTGVKTSSGAVYEAGAVILCTGVYLDSRCIYGEVSTETGPNGLQNSLCLSSSLRQLGLKLTRFKTGTPARVDGRTVDFSRMEEQKGDASVTPFSFSTDPASVQIPQDSCWLTYTNEETHRIIRENIHRSPLFSGEIRGTGPRYCPSIEDKVMRFPHKDRHQLFLEPEGRYTREMYISGMSSSLPEDVQHAMIHTVPGLEHANIVRPAYAIEYDCLAPGQLKLSLECRQLGGLYFAGQANGSSGYEEAAAQGLIAGINAVQQIRGREPLILDRSEAYIGVLIDDLVTKENHEPYRMMTSRAEYRLMLRQDNADLRLTAAGCRVGLVPQDRYEAVEAKRRAIEKETERLKTTFVGVKSGINTLLASRGAEPLSAGASLADLIRRPQLDYECLGEYDPDRPVLSDYICQQVNIQIKYEGYIERERLQIEKFRKLEEKRIPEDTDYDSILSLRLEARQKLKEYRPASVGQASRIAGVSPADISVLLVYLHYR